MASIVILTRAKLAGRTGPSSARYEIGRNNALAESLTLRGHEVVMWWDEPLGPCLLETPDLVVIRSGGEINIGRARMFRDQGVLVLNDPEAHWLSSDKWATVDLLTQGGVAHPQTALATGPMPGAQYVLKERRSSGGHGVSLCEGSAIPNDERFVVQERMFWSDDLRAMVVDGRVEHWLRRRPAEGEWRTNIAQGSHYSSALDVSPQAEALALRAAHACNLLWCGVDLLEVNGEWTVLEVNPGTTFHGVTREEGQAIVESVADAIERTLH